MSFFRRKPTPTPPSPDSIRCKRLELVDGDRRARVVFMTVPNGGAPWLSFYDAAGTGRLVMGLRPDGTPFLLLWDAQGRALFEAP